MVGKEIKELAEHVQRQMNVVWSCSKTMQLMTASQLNHY